MKVIFIKIYFMVKELIIVKIENMLENLKTQKCMEKENVKQKMEHGNL